MKTPPVTLALAATFVGLLCRGAVEATAEDLPYPTNRVGWADANGALSIWLDEGWKLDLGGGEELPLRLQFCGKQERIADGSLGAGWWVPLLESTVVAEAETYVRMTTLGGQYFFLNRDPKDESRYVSPDAEWVGTKMGDRFVVKGPNEWKFIYSKGRIDGAESPSGRRLKWNYSPNTQSVRSISGEGGRELLAVKMDDGSGLVRHIDIAEGPSLAFKYGQLPKVAMIEGMAMIAGLQPYARQVVVMRGGEEVGGASLDATVQRDGEGKLKYVKDGGGGGVGDSDAETLVWDVATGVLRADSSGEYVLEWMRGDDFLPKITRTSGDGAIESYYWDAKNFVESRELDGRFREKKYIGTPGASFMKIREMRITEVDGLVSKIVNSFDANGQLLRVHKESPNGESSIISSPVKMEPNAVDGGRVLVRKVSDNELSVETKESDAGGQSVLRCERGRWLLYDGDGKRASGPAIRFE